MKASDFVSTSTERDNAALRLIQTEETDAVNTGLVGSADKSGSALKGASVIHKAAKGGVSNAALAAVTSGRKRGYSRSLGDTADSSGSGPFTENTVYTKTGARRGTRSRLSAEDRAAVEFADGSIGASGGRSLKSHLKGGARAAASSAAATAVGKTLEGTELEGVDDLYYKGKAARSVFRYARRRFRGVSDVTGSAKTAGRRALSLSGRNAGPASANSPLGSLSEKRAGSKAGGSLASRQKAQMMGYFKRNVYATATQTKVATATSSSVVRRLIPSAGDSIKGMLAAVGSALAPLLLGVVALVLLVAIFGAAGGGNKTAESESSGSITAAESQVAAYLMSQGLDELHTAAIMGNMYAESGIDPTSTEAGGTGIGICQWSYGRANSLRSYATSQGKSWTDLSVQLDFFWNHDIWQSEWQSRYVIRVHRVDGDPAVGEVVSGSKTRFLESTDLDEATKLFCYGWERPGVPRINERLEAAQRYYTALLSGGIGGQDYASAEQWQKDIVDAANRVPSPGAGWCAKWVSNVYSAAGLPAPSGNACCMYLNYCTSSDPSELRVGMLVAVQESATSYGIWNYGHYGYGHVGIYIGDGNVISNEGGPIVTRSLDSWTSIYGVRSQVRWGFPPGVS